MRPRCRTRNWPSSIPGAGSSYLFAEQAFLDKTHAYRFARIAKFVIGWASHLYYWVYPGVMVATMGVMVGYIIGNIAPNTLNPATPGPVFMALIAIIFSYFVAYIAFRGVTGSTMVNIAINAIQIAALLFFSALAIAYRVGHPDGSTGLALDSHGNVVSAVLNYALGGDNPSHPSALSVDPAASLRLGDAAGDDRDSAAGRLRIGHLVGRRSQESQAGHPARGAPLADDSGPVLLPD